LSSRPFCSVIRVAHQVQQIMGIRKQQTTRTRKQQTGDSGEKEIARKAPCPNCGKKLVRLPKNFPLYDVACEGCSFRAQVKTTISSPKSTVRGAGWDIIHKVLKAGFLAPPLIVDFKCEDRQRTESVILFFPFVAKNHMEHYSLGKHHRQKGYKMFNYVELTKLPHFRLIPHGKKRLWETGSSKEENVPQTK
jgi:hypothetical protein